jgi:type IV pilus assembly protein PilF
VRIFDLRVRILLGALFALILSACANRTLEGSQSDAAPTAEKQESQNRSSIRMQLAVGYYQQGLHKVALEEIKQALQASPDLVDAYSLRALIFMDTGEIQAAEDNFLRAIRLAPGNSDLANNYGWFLCQNGREKQSIAYFEKAIKDLTYSAPDKVLSNAGVCSLRLKDVASAERYFMRGFREQPGNPSINVNLAKIYYDQGDYEKAKFYIDRVIKAEIMAADVLWLAIKIENKRLDQVAVTGLSTQLRRRHPTSKEYALLQRGAFDE